MSFGRNGTARTHTREDKLLLFLPSLMPCMCQKDCRASSVLGRKTVKIPTCISLPKKLQDIRCQEFNAASSLWPTQQRDVSRQKFHFYNSSSSKNSAGAKNRIYFLVRVNQFFRLFRTLSAAHIQ